MITVTNMKYLLLLLPVLLNAQFSGFYDFNTEQFGGSAKVNLTISDPAQLTLGVRHQQYITTFDAILGREIEFNDLLFRFGAGLSSSFTDTVDATGATAIIQISQELTNRLYLTIHFQPTYNASRFPIDWQNQAGAGIYYQL